MQIIKKIVETFIEQNIIEENDKAIYEYGIYEGCILLFNILTILVIGLITNRFLECVLFSTIYAYIRAFAGGSHATTHKKCYFLSVCILLTALLAIEYFPVKLINYTAITFIVILPIFIHLAPVEDANKPLDTTEIRHYKKRAIRRFLLIILLCLVAAYSNNVRIYCTLYMAIIFNLFSMIKGKCKNKRIKFMEI